MKRSMLSVLAVILLAGNVALAEREDPLQIFAELKRATKVFSGASDLFASGQREVLLTEESYVQTSLNYEASLLNQLTGSDVQRNGPHCVEFIRTNVNLLMSLTGIAYTNCLNEVDDKLFGKLSDATNAALTRDQYDQLNLLGVFRGENIFVDPSKIRQKLANWQQVRTQLELTPEATTTLRATFDELKDSFRTCMAVAQSRLANNLNFASQQVRAICAGEVAGQV